MRVAILTGGGDCPGLNAVIRATVRKATALGWTTLGVADGWAGLSEGRWRLQKALLERVQIVGVGD